MRFHVYIAMSLDGYVATPNGDVQWLEPFNGCDYGYEKFIASIDTIVIGRVTYEQSLTFGEWPYKGNRVIVQSSRSLDNLPPDTELWEGTTAELVTHLRERPQGKDVWLIGGPRSIESFAELGAVDFYDMSSSCLSCWETASPSFRPRRDRRASSSSRRRPMTTESSAWSMNQSGKESSARSGNWVLTQSTEVRDQPLIGV